MIHLLDPSGNTKEDAIVERREWGEEEEGEEESKGGGEEERDKGKLGG